MDEDNRPVYCPRCGSIVQSGDQFCGVCGARITPDAQDASPTREIPTLVQPPPSVPSRRRNRKLINGVMVGVLLIVLLAGAGAVVLTKFERERLWRLVRGYAEDDERPPPLRM